MKLSSSFNTQALTHIQNVPTHAKRVSSEETVANDAAEDASKQQKHIQNQDIQKTIAQTTGIGLTLNLLA